MLQARLVELEGPGVPYSRHARIRNRTRTDLAERGPQFVDVEIDEMGRPLVAKRGERPQEALAGEPCIGAKRQRTHHVLSAADTAVEYDGGLFANRRDNRRQAIDRRRQRLDLPSAVV